MLLDIIIVVTIIVLGVFVVRELTQTVGILRQRNAVTPTATPEFLVVPNQSVEEQPEGADDRVENDMWSLQLPNLDGEVIRLGDYLGTPILVNFWATWCPPCLEEMPLIQAYAHQYEGDLVVLAINAGEGSDIVQEFVTEHELDLLILLDPAGDAVKQFRVYGFPTSMFFDADGILQSTHLGELDEALLIANLLKIGIGE